MYLETPQTVPFPSKRRGTVRVLDMNTWGYFTIIPFIRFYTPNKSVGRRLRLNRPEKRTLTQNNVVL